MHRVSKRRLFFASKNSTFFFVSFILTEEVGNAAAFLASPLASAIMGAVVYVDNGLNAMRVGVDSPVFKDLDNPKDKSHETVKQAVSV